MIVNILFTIFLMTLCQLLPLVAQSKESANLPLYELGVGGGYFHLPYYQGSEQMRTRTIGLPFIIYRGKVLKSDDEGGTRAELYKDLDLRVDLSFSGGFSARSSEVVVRKGMPDLDYMGAMGPRIVWTIYKKKLTKIKFNLPLRAVGTSDFKRLRDQGFVFHPNFAFSRDDLFFSWFDLFIRTGILFADERYMEYYYEVPPRFALFERPAYKAKAGLLEAHLDVAAGIRLSSRWRMFLGVGYSNYNWAANKESPLLNDRDTILVGLGLVWTIYESDERAGKWL